MKRTWKKLTAAVVGCTINTVVIIGGIAIGLDKTTCIAVAGAISAPIIAYIVGQGIADTGEKEKTLNSKGL